MSNSARALRLVLVAVVAAIAPGCGGKSKGSTALMKDEGGAAPKVDPTLCDTESKKVVAFDLDRDTRPDVWKLYKKVEEGETTVEVLTCKQVDINHDGDKDYVVAYNRKGATVFEKVDLDFDGRFDAFYQFDDDTGEVFEVQRETGFDGRYDVQEVYDKGVLKTVKHDRNADGEPDKWEQYDGGELVAILYDDDYDNKVDRREEVGKKAKPAAGTGEPAEAGTGGAAEGDTEGSGEAAEGDAAGSAESGAADSDAGE